MQAIDTAAGRFQGNTQFGRRNAFNLCALCFRIAKTRANGTPSVRWTIKSDKIGSRRLIANILCGFSGNGNQLSNGKLIAPQKDGVS